MSLEKKLGRLSVLFSYTHKPSLRTPTGFAVGAGPHFWDRPQVWDRFCAAPNRCPVTGCSHLRTSPLHRRWGGEGW